ncbi:MAG: CHRD domain-containing protein [Pirellulaceae bacterium]
MVRILVIAFAIVVTQCAITHADIWQFNVTLNGAQEVPANGSPGTGFATAFFNDITGSMTISGTFSGLTANASAAHLHGFAPPGVNAGVLIGLTVTPGTSGTISGAGSINNVGANFANTLGGLTYLNIHNANFPGGEIRGQMTNPFSVPEPGSLAILSLCGMMALVRRKRKN